VGKRKKNRKSGRRSGRKGYREMRVIEGLNQGTVHSTCISIPVCQKYNSHALFIGSYPIAKNLS